MFHSTDILLSLGVTGFMQQRSRPLSAIVALQEPGPPRRLATQCRLLFESASQGGGFWPAAGLAVDDLRWAKGRVLAGFERVLGPFQVRFRFVPGSSFCEKGHFHWEI
jgi:hypothetical protein